MKNSLSENMLRFGTKNLSESTKQHLAYLNEEEDPPAQKKGGNTNLFEKLILTVDIGTPGGKYAGEANKVVTGRKAYFEMEMLGTEGEENPLNRYFTQYKKYPPILEIKVNGFNIAQKGGITSNTPKKGVLAGSVNLLLYTTYADMLKRGDDPFKPINANIDKTFENPTSDKIHGALPRSGGFSVTFDFSKFTLNNTTASEYPTQSPRVVQIISNPI